MNEYGSISSSGGWVLFTLQYYLLFLTDDTQSDPGYINHGLGINPTTTSHSIVTSGAKATVAGGPQDVTFYVNNNTGADRTYKLWFNESYGGLDTNAADGETNSYYQTNTNRLYATKIQ